MTPLHAKFDPRRVQRVALALSATAREPGQSSVPIRVIDISTHGCRIEMINGTFVGFCIWLTIAGLEAKRSRVVWHRDSFAGIEFDTPFNEAALDSLLVAHHRSAKTIAGDLRKLASRTRRLSMCPDAPPDLLRFARDCSVQALVHGLKLAEKPQTDGAGPQLTGSIIRRNATDQPIGPGFSFALGVRPEQQCIGALVLAHPKAG